MKAAMTKYQEELPEDSLDLSVPTLLELGIDTDQVFSEMEKLTVPVSLKIEPDILYINEKMVAVREATRRAQTLYIRIQQAACVAENKLLEFETNYDILMNSTLENDSEVLKGQSSTERLAAAGNKHIDYKRAVRATKLLVSTLKKLEKALALCQRNLRSSEESVKSQLRLMEAMLHNLKGGDTSKNRENPLFKEAAKELDELDALADSILAQQGSEDTAEVTIESDEGTEGRETTEETAVASDLDDELTVKPHTHGRMSVEGNYPSGTAEAETTEEPESVGTGILNGAIDAPDPEESVLVAKEEGLPRRDAFASAASSKPAKDFDPDFDMEIDPGLTGAPATPAASELAYDEPAEEAVAAAAAPATPTPVSAPAVKPETAQEDVLVGFDDEDDVMSLISTGSEELSDPTEQIIPVFLGDESDFSGLDDMVASVDEKEAKPPKPTAQATAPVHIPKTKAPVVAPAPSKVPEQAIPAKATVKETAPETVDDFLAELGLL